MKKIFMKRGSRMAALLLAMAMIVTSFAWIMPVNAESTPDLKKANVKWDLKNNKTVKYKTAWYALGVKTHTVKMTKFKVKKAKKKGYKQCTFTLTFNRKIKPNKEQIMDMDLTHGECGSFGGECYFTIVDYMTGESLEGPNDKGVKVSSKWKWSGKDTKDSKDGFGIWYMKKGTVKVTITYPKGYKNLAIGVGGYTKAPYYVDYEDDYEVVNPAAGMKDYYNGGRPFSGEELLYSKTDKGFAHLMRVKK